MTGINSKTSSRFRLVTNRFNQIIKSISESITNNIIQAIEALYPFRTIHILQPPSHLFILNMIREKKRIYQLFQPSRGELNLMTQSNRLNELSSLLFPRLQGWSLLLLLTKDTNWILLGTMLFNLFPLDHPTLIHPLIKEITQKKTTTYSS